MSLDTIQALRLAEQVSYLKRQIASQQKAAVMTEVKKFAGVPTRTQWKEGAMRQVVTIQEQPRLQWRRLGWLVAQAATVAWVVYVGVQISGF